MSDIPTVGITGDWNGLYAYGGRAQAIPPVRFQASFAAPDRAGGFAGTITDADGVGEADAAGAVDGLQVRFVKTYRWSRFRKTYPIAYEGTLSEDGRSLSGVWHIQGRLLGVIPLRTEGVWRAQRPGLPEPPVVWPPPPLAP